MTTPNEELSKLIRELRRKPIPLADIIPALQRAADRIDRLEAENEAKDRLLVRALHGIDEAWVESIEGAAWKEEVAQHLKGTP